MLHFFISLYFFYTFHLNPKIILKNITGFDHEIIFFKKNVVMSHFVIERQNLRYRISYQY